jgi:hypothetical protein
MRPRSSIVKCAPASSCGELTRPGRRQVKLLLSRVSGTSRGARILKAVDFIAGQLQLARLRHHRSEKLARHAVLHLRLAERSRWLNERPKKNRYSQTKIDVPQPHWRRGLAAQDDQLLMQDNVFTFSPGDFSRDCATSRSPVRNANIVPSISATIALRHPGGGFR